MIIQPEHNPFNRFGLHSDVIRGIESLGFGNPTPVQNAAIPEIIKGNDIIACAQTGTGKTAAFLIPVINEIIINNTGKTSTLIIVPTRELTVQIDNQLQGLGYFADISSKPVYGGGDGSGWDLEKSALIKGSDVIIATPGKILQHLTMGYVKFDAIRHLILDEADRMLDMGFSEDIIRIISFLPKRRQNLLFSATMPPKIRDLARQILINPVEINISTDKPADGVIQAAYLVDENCKTDLVRKLIENKKLNSVLIFASTKSAVKNLARSLAASTKLRIREMHSDLEQSKREETLNGFRNRNFEILVATDILSRGIDIDKIEVIINYNVPSDPEDYVHRVGRTARVDQSGLAITLVNYSENDSFKKIERFIGREIYKTKLPEGIHYSDKSGSQKRRRKSITKKR